MERIARLTNHLHVHPPTSDVRKNISECGAESREWGSRSLLDLDPQMYKLIEHEELRQRGGLELIASENFTSRAVMQTIGTCLTNKYSEGQPDARYYGGNQFIDQIEKLCQKRGLEAFHLDPNEWGVNVQSYSGSGANFAVCTALLPVHGRIMGLDLPSGGHLSHGYYRGSSRMTASSRYFESLPYSISQKTGLVDYDALESQAKLYRPNLIIAGASSYARDWDLQRLRKISDAVGAYLLFDMSHYSGLVASGLVNNPFEVADVVTSTTHKALRGPRAALIFFRSKFKQKINSAVFPGLQGGPHNHSIAAVAVQLAQVNTTGFRRYSKQVIDNAKHLASELIKMGYKVVTGGTDNHLILLDLRPQKLTGSKLSELCDLAHITVNKNTVPGDKSAANPGGIRLGTPALTSRGLVEKDFTIVAVFLDRAIKLALEIQKKSGRKLVNFKRAITSNPSIQALGTDVRKFSLQFFMPGEFLEDKAPSGGGRA